MATDNGNGLATQVFVLAKDVAKIEQQVEALGERSVELHAALDAVDLGPLQEAIDHIEDRTAGMQAEVASVAPLRDAITALTGQVAQIRQDLTAMAAAPAEEKLALWDWTTMNQEQAHEAWLTLISWVRDELADQYGWVGPPADALAGGYGTETGPPARIPPCWYRHPDAVRELSWLCQEWLKLYRTSYGTPSKAGDWHDRYAPGVRRRLAAALHKCRNGHQNDALARPPQGVDDDEALSDYVSYDINRRPPGPPPGPVQATS
jgi:hypothetical protein